MPAKGSFRELLIAALRCRCPNCHKGLLFRGWPNRMYPRCSVCGLSFFRESGYYVGGMIFSYIVTAAILVLVYLIQLQFHDVKSLTDNERLGIWLVFALAVNLALMRYAYSLWLALDYWMDHWQPGDTEP
jgi:uncharacterized protein (DUF983 family)